MTAPAPYILREGTGRLIVSVPHAATYIPPEIAACLTPEGCAVVDTDWHVDRLYGFLSETDATVIVATHARTVVDLNRPPDGEKLYPGQAETGICPTETFAGAPLYVRDTPAAAERARRLQLYWQPYHAALAAALGRIRALHGTARLLDAHSIRAHVPRLFAGTLPDLNFGTNGYASCRPVLLQRAIGCIAGSHFTHVVDGRFKGGYITRHYGAPDAGVDALQLELAQSAYMNEPSNGVPPSAFDAVRAAPLARLLTAVVAELSRP